MSRLIVIQGKPGTGKTTLARKLANDLGFVFLSKDMIKEFIFDSVGVENREESRVIGKFATQALYIFADGYLRANKSVIIESAFHAKLAKNDISDLLSKHHCQYVEIYCKTKPGIWQERVLKRVQTGNRHPGHFDKNEKPTYEGSEYGPIGIKPSLGVDTSNFNNEKYLALLGQIREIVHEPNLQ